MPLYLREDNGSEDLDPEQVDANWKSLYDVPSPLDVVNGVLTVQGQGAYTVDTQNNDPTDEITQISGLPSGQVVILRAEAAGRVTTLIHGTNLRLSNGASFSLETVYSNIRLRSLNGTIVYEEHRSYVP